MSKKIDCECCSKFIFNRLSNAKFCKSCERSREKLRRKLHYKIYILRQIIKELKEKKKK